MKSEERAIRISAWTWTAQTLGITATPERIDGLVDVTRCVRVENLRPALERLMQSEPQGYLPSPGAVIAAANRIADRKHSATPRIGSGHELSHDEHERLMAELNPQGWSLDQHRAHMKQMHAKVAYAQAFWIIIKRRHVWASQQGIEETRGRSVSIGYRTRLRRRLNTDAVIRFPSADPLASSA